MENNLLEIKTSIQIQKPVHKVFDAIIDPAKMTNYFISESTGKMEEGSQLNWKFPEFDIQVPVTVDKMEQDKYISFYWGNDTPKLLVEITLTPLHDDTLVTVIEKSKENNEAGIKWLQGNTAGWANFLACLKAYLDHGVNLRKGAFEFMRGMK